MKNNTVVFFLILILIIPTLASATGTLITKNFGKYTITLSQNFESGMGKISIKKGQNKVFGESGIDNHYYLGNTFDESLNSKDSYSGRNITGNGIPNLVISKWTGGAHCCNFLYIFELGKKIKKIATVEGNSSSLRFVDLDHDGFPEIEFWDGAIDYLFACFAGSPGGRVVLKFHDDHYEVATQLMKKPNLSLIQIEMIKNKLKVAFKKEESPDLPYEFLNTMMDLSYSGNFELAKKIAADVWPKKKVGLSQFKKKFSQALSNSPYWKNFTSY